jgi:hypothetical protein
MIIILIIQMKEIRVLVYIQLRSVTLVSEAHSIYIYKFILQPHTNYTVTVTFNTCIHRHALIQNKTHTSAVIPYWILRDLYWNVSERNGNLRSGFN